MNLTTADRLLLDARLSPVQQRAIVAWLADAEDNAKTGDGDLCDRASRLFSLVLAD